MKKRGYTLAETLIALGIIGIAATLVAPTFKHLIPNKEKMEFMECYKLLTNALPAISYAPGSDDYKYDYDKKLNRGMVYSTCLGIACVNNLASEISQASSTSNYTWTADYGGGTTINNITRYYDSATVTCRSQKSGNSFSFYLDGRGTITGFDEKGTNFMKDQFNYYKKGTENEDE